MSELPHGEPFDIAFEVLFHERTEDPVFGVSLRNEAGHTVFATTTQWSVPETGGVRGRRVGDRARPARQLVRAEPLHASRPRWRAQGSGADTLDLREDLASVIVHCDAGQRRDRSTRRIDSRSSARECRHVNHASRNVTGGIVVEDSGASSRSRWTLALTDWKLRFYGSVLGYVWTLARPFAFFGVIYVVFTEIAHLGDDVKNYGVYILFALVLFNFFAEVTNGCLRSLIARENLLRKISLPAPRDPAAGRADRAAQPRRDARGGVRLRGGQRRVPDVELARADPARRCC